VVNTCGAHAVQLIEQTVIFIVHTHNETAAWNPMVPTTESEMMKYYNGPV